MVRKGSIVSENRCKKDVHSDGGFHYHRCFRKIWKDGWCKQHHPETEKAARKAREAKWDAESKAREAHWARQRENARKARAYDVIMSYCAHRGKFSTVKYDDIIKLMTGVE